MEHSTNLLSSPLSQYYWRAARALLEARRAPSPCWRRAATAYVQVLGATAQPVLPVEGQVLVSGCCRGSRMLLGAALCRPSEPPAQQRASSIWVTAPSERVLSRWPGPSVPGRRGSNHLLFFSSLSAPFCSGQVPRDAPGGGDVAPRGVQGSCCVFGHTFLACYSWSAQDEEAGKLELGLSSCLLSSVRLGSTANSGISFGSPGKEDLGVLCQALRLLSLREVELRLADLALGFSLGRSVLSSLVRRGGSRLSCNSFFSYM